MPTYHTLIPRMATNADAATLNSVASKLSTIAQTTAPFAATINDLSAWTPASGDLTNPLGTLKATLSAIQAANLSQTSASLGSIAIGVQGLVTQNALLQAYLKTLQTKVSATTPGAIPTAPHLPLGASAASAAGLGSMADALDAIAGPASLFAAAITDIGQSWTPPANYNTAALQNALNVSDALTQANLPNLSASLRDVQSAITATIATNNALQTQIATARTQIVAKNNSAPVKSTNPTTAAGSSSSASPMSMTTVVLIGGVLVVGAAALGLFKSSPPKRPLRRAHNPRLRS